MDKWRWYIHRLRAMSFGEVAWRFQQKCKEYQERKYARRPVSVITKVFNESLSPLKLDARKLGIEFQNGNHTCTNDIRLLGGYDYGQYKKRWKAGFQTPNDWPKAFSHDIDYKQCDAIGDARTNWELNRHFQLALLAKNYYYTRDKKLLEELTELLNDWCDNAPFLIGISWTSVMEVAIRAVNWMYMLAYLKETDSISSNLETCVNTGILNMLNHVQRHLSRYSSANNHLMIESAALALGGYAFGYEKWKKHAIETLTTELARQTTPDGVNREMSLHYHAFVLEAYSLTAHCIRSNGDSVPSSWLTYMQQMSEFICHSQYDETHLIAFGDDDEGKVIDLQGGMFSYYDYVLQMSSLITGKRYSPFSMTNETVNCLFPESDITESCHQSLYSPGTGRCFRDGGYTFLRSNDGEVLIAIDHAPLGFGSIAAHGHADALSFQMMVGGMTVLADPGTYIYHCDLPARNDFRKTVNHNTISVAGADQSEMLGAFLWGRKANCRLLHHDINAHQSTLTAEHDGYAPVITRRTFEFDHEKKRLTITDDLDRESDIVLTYMVAPDIDIQDDNGSMILTHERGKCQLTFSSPSRFTVSIEPAVFSANYGLKSPTKAIRCRSRCKDIISIININ